MLKVIELKGAASCPKCRREYRTAFILYIVDAHSIPARKPGQAVAIDTHEESEASR
jgi:hypothetical protein